MIDLPRVGVQPFFICPPQPLLPADATPMPSDVIPVASRAGVMEVCVLRTIALVSTCQ